MTKDEALRLALEALESTGENNGYHGVTQYFDETMVDQAITAIKAALEAKDEPVIDKSAAKRIATQLGWEPQRTWVGLTDEEREQVINANTATGLWHMAKDIEAKLKEKNT